jgi:hypothetical protein
MAMPITSALKNYSIYSFLEAPTAFFNVSYSGGWQLYEAAVM